MIDLLRFLDAQDGRYTEALAELTAGEKRTHWMWFIFPQVAGLGNPRTRNSSLPRIQYLKVCRFAGKCSFQQSFARQ